MYKLDSCKKRGKRGVSLTLFFLACLFLITIIPTGEARLGEFPTGECVDIKTIANVSEVNISSISYPNSSSTNVSNVVMSKNSSTFNYTFCDTSTRGVYTYDYFYDTGESFVNDFKISQIADTINTGQALTYIILIFVVLIFLFIAVFVAVTTPYANIEEATRNGTAVLEVTKTKYVKLLAIWLSYGLFLWLVTIVTGLTNNYIIYENLRTLTSNAYIWFSNLGYGITILIISWLFIALWKDIILSKSIRENGKALLKELGT